jgi:hypothetical protein
MATPAPVVAAAVALLNAEAEGRAAAGQESRGAHRR